MYAQKKTKLAPSFAADTDTVQGLRAHRMTEAVITANSILGGHETRTGFRRRNAQLSEMGALSVKVEGINVRLHPTDREVYAEMKVLLDQPICLLSSS